MKYYNVIFQVFLCAVLLVSLIIIKAQSTEKTVEAGAFGKTHYNITLSDFYNNIYSELLYD